MTDSLYDSIRRVCAEHWDFDRCRNCPLMEKWGDALICKLLGPPGCWADEKELADMIGYKKQNRFLDFIGVEIED